MRKERNITNFPTIKDMENDLDTSQIFQSIGGFLQQGLGQSTTLVVATRAQTKRIMNLRLNYLSLWKLLSN